ncbi:MAG: hypothetical protein AAF941_06960 [Pseudomonadota bacterium]
MTKLPTNISSLSPTDIQRVEGPPKAWTHPAPGDASMRSHVQQWQAHLDAGRIGNNPPCPPEVAARREANERLFARLAGRR